MAKLFATVMAFVFGITFGVLGVVQATDMPAEKSAAPAAEGKAGEDHGKAGEDHGKAGDTHGKSADDQGKTAEKGQKKGHAKKPHTKKTPAS
ncbi:MAG: hypothetical protein OEY80_12340 [Nitrospirota bacterium]|nr:hypothetical protein [Nitrospirota bacterium]